MVLPEIIFPSLSSIKVIPFLLSSHLKEPGWMLSPYNLEGIENTAIPSPKSVGKYLGKDRVVDK